AGVAERAGEAEAGQRGDHQVEGVGRVAAVGPWVGEGADQPQELHDRSRPAVEQQRRSGRRLGGADMGDPPVRSGRGPVAATSLGPGSTRRWPASPSWPPRWWVARWSGDPSWVGPWSAGPWSVGPWSVGPWSAGR